jgi:hypothetical protein
MRKLAGEAAIFALLGLVVATMGVLLKLYTDARVAARTKAAEAVHAKDYQLQGAESSNSIVVVTLDNGTILEVRRCPNFDPKTAYESAGRMMAALETRARHNGPSHSDARTQNDLLSSPSQRTASQPAESVEYTDCRNFSGTKADRGALERDYWTAYRDSTQQALAGNVSSSFAVALFGLPAGLGVWIVYRRVRVRATINP